MGCCSLCNYLHSSGAKLDLPLDSDPLAAGKYSSPITIDYTFYNAPVTPDYALKPGLESTPIVQTRWAPHMADRVVPQPLYKALSHRMVNEDMASPYTPPIENYGFRKIADGQKPPLATPIYGYAAIDTEEYMDDVRSRISHKLYGYY